LLLLLLVVVVVAVGLLLVVVGLLVVVVELLVVVVGLLLVVVGLLVVVVAVGLLVAVRLLFLLWQHCGCHRTEKVSEIKTQFHVVSTTEFRGNHLPATPQSSQRIFHIVLPRVAFMV
jgi:hypothetical protein